MGGVEKSVGRSSDRVKFIEYKLQDGVEGFARMNASVPRITHEKNRESY